MRVTIYITDFGNFPKVNEIMAEYFQEPYPARVTIGAASLPRGARVGDRRGHGGAVART